MPYATIDQCIAFAAADIAALSYGGTKSLYTYMTSWNTGMFGAAGIFPPSANVTAEGNRRVSDWFYESLAARDSIEGTGIGASGVFGTANCINVVVRELFAVKYATTDNKITTAQRAAVIALYNATWL